jgi:PAS domain S-box-containing protein
MTIDRLLETMRAFAEAATDYARLLDTVAERMTQFMGEGCTIYLVTPDGQWLKPAAIYNRNPAALALMRATVSEIALSVDGESFTAGVMRTGKSALVPEVDRQLTARQYAPQHAQTLANAFFDVQLNSLLCVPLQVRDKRLGVLALSRHRRQDVPFSAQDQAMANTLADHAALAIFNAQLLATQANELSERRRAEDETKRFAALIQHSRDFIAMAGIDGRVLFINHAGRELLGLPADREVASLAIAQFHTDEGMKRASIIREQGHWEGEGHLRHFQTGALIPTQISSFLMRANDGQALGFATIQRDLRETRRLEEHLRQAQKMEAIGRLAGGVAHDFNNLLSIILSYTWLTLEDLSSDSPLREDLLQISLAGERAAALTQQLLAFSRQQVLELHVADLNELVTGMEKLIRRMLGEDIELTMQLGTPLGKIRVDKTQIEQVLLNLAVNARDALPNGGTLSIATQNVDRVADVATDDDGLTPGPYVMLTVTDSGIGMDEATRARVFEPFFTTKPIGKGTGLGLATVFGIVKQSAGQVSVVSEPGGGTTFRIYLPRCDSEAVTTPTLRPAAAQVHSALAATILLVEDDAQVRTLMQTILKRAGYQVLDYADPLEAIERCERSPEHIDLLLTDVVLPKLNGRYLAERVLALRPLTRVIYVSGYSEETISERGVLEAGAVLLKKPITPAALLERVRSALDA